MFIERCEGFWLYSVIRNGAEVVSICTSRDGGEVMTAKTVKAAREWCKG